MVSFDEVLERAENELYIDWGVVGDMYQNCPTKEVADKVADNLKAKGYTITIQTMGKGSNVIAEGTPICYRVSK